MSSRGFDQARHRSSCILSGFFSRCTQFPPPPTIAAMVPAINSFLLMPRGGLQFFGS